MKDHAKERPEEAKAQEAALQGILQSNGLSDSCSHPNGTPVQQLELFLHNYSQITALEHFPALRCLKIAQQNICRLEGLAACTVLEELWVVECRLTRLEGLHNCTALQRLYLYDNQISKIEGLLSLANLQVLHLADNAITSIEGLQILTHLQELNLANNPIQTLGRGLAANLALQDLNLSATKLGSFRDIWLLSFLPALKRLLLSDMQWGSARLALLSNYRSNVLVRLTELTSLDHINVTEEERASALATLENKRVYYSMKARVLQRRCRDAMRAAERGLQAAVSEPRAIAARSSVQLEILKEQLREVETYGEPAAARKLSVLRSEIAPQEALQLKIAAEVSALENGFAAGMLQAEARCRQAVRWLDLELETGGNVRLEHVGEGTPTFASCAKLLVPESGTPASHTPRSRRSPRTLTVIPPQLRSVQRIHNHANAIRFEEACERLQARHMTAGCRPHTLMYLIAEGDDLQYIVEQGFRKGEAVRLLDPRALVLPSGHYPTSGAMSRYLIVQAVLGPYGKDLVSVPSTSGTSWQLLDHTLAIPQYLVDISFPAGRNGIREVAGRPKLAQDVSHAMLPLLPFITTASLAKADRQELGISKMLDAEAVSPITMPWASRVLCSTWLDQGDDTLAPDTTRPGWETTVLEVHLEQRGLREIGGIGGMTHLQRASFARNSITGLQALPQLSALQRLNLQGNHICSLAGMEAASGLITLDVSYNRLSSLEGISALSSLQLCCLEGNQLISLQGLPHSLHSLFAAHNSLARSGETLALIQLPRLVVLDLAGNPISQDQQYRHFAIYHLPNLKVLDGDAVTVRERAAAGEEFRGLLLPEALAAKLGHASFHRVAELQLQDLGLRSLGDVLQGDAWPCLRNLNLAGNQLTGIIGLSSLHQLTALDLSRNPLGPACCLAYRQRPRSDSKAAQWLPLFAKLQMLCLEEAGLTAMGKLRLDGMRDLRVLGLARNMFASTARLGSLPALQELILDNNAIRSITPNQWKGLSSLACLRLSHNCLSDLAGLEDLPALTALRADNNRIAGLANLRHISCLPCLLDLHIADNKVSKKQGVRIALLQACPSLTAIDGTAVTAEERERAEQPQQESLGSQYSGDLDRFGKVAGFGRAEQEGASQRWVMKMAAINFENVLPGHPQRRQLHPLNAVPSPLRGPEQTCNGRGITRRPASAGMANGTPPYQYRSSEQRQNGAVHLTSPFDSFSGTVGLYASDMQVRMLGKGSARPLSANGVQMSPPRRGRGSLDPAGMDLSKERSNGFCVHGNGNTGRSGRCRPASAGGLVGVPGRNVAWEEVSVRGVGAGGSRAQAAGVYAIPARVFRAALRRN